MIKSNLYFVNKNSLKSCLILSRFLFFKIFHNLFNTFLKVGLA